MSAPGAGRWLAIAATLVVAATVVAAIFAMGGPAEQRQMRLDARRVDDLGNLAGEVRAYFESQGKLPPDLATLANQPGNKPRLDPETQAPYAYEIVNPRRFRLCAVFANDSERMSEDAGIWTGDAWKHPAGRHCFERKAETPAPGAATASG